jgi:hypothetical protein
MYFGIHVKCLLFLSNLNETWNLLNTFFKNSQISNFIKICPVGAELFCAIGRASRQEGGHDEAKSQLNSLFAVLRMCLKTC